MQKYRDILVKFQEHEHAKKMDHLDSLAPVRMFQNRKRKRVCLGDARLQSIRYYLDNLGFERSKMQKEFHESFLRAVCLHLYRDDVDVDLTRVMRDNNWPDLKQQVVSG